MHARSAAVCALPQRGSITQRGEVGPATRSRQAAACTATLGAAIRGGAPRAWAGGWAKPAG